MDDTLLMTAGAVGILLAGIGIGFLISQLVIGRRTAKADDVQQQFDEYRREVTEHFGRTAEHFQAIGKQYRELYEHMAVGADALCDRDAIDEKLSFKPAAMLEASAAGSDADSVTAPRDYAEETPDEDASSEAESLDAAADDEHDRPSDDTGGDDAVDASADDQQARDGEDEDDETQPKKGAGDDGEAQPTLH